MKFVKQPEEERNDYIFQKNTKTKFGTKFVIITLLLLIVGVIITGVFFEF